MDEGIKIGIKSGKNRPISAAGFWFKKNKSEFYIYDGTTDRTLDYSKRETHKSSVPLYWKLKG
jgi:hypothetical protein